MMYQTILKANNSEAAFFEYELYEIMFKRYLVPTGFKQGEDVANATSSPVL
jgi:hypothetical protein